MNSLDVALGICLGLVIVFLVVTLFDALKPQKSKSEVDYTHWDIHALARVLDPDAWKSHDATPASNYLDFPETRRSFTLAVSILASGYKPPHGHLWSDAELKAHLKG